MNKKIKILLDIAYVLALYAGLHTMYLVGYEAGEASKKPVFKGEFHGATIIDADHIERTWIYRDTVEYSRPKIKFTL